MATITAAQSGNWSSTSTWVGGVVPGPGDDVYSASDYVITIDQDITVNTLNPGNSGGYFVVTGYTVNADTHATGGGAGQTAVLRCLGSGVQNGNSYGDSGYSVTYATSVLEGGVQNGDSYGDNGTGTFVSRGGVQNGDSYVSSTYIGYGSFLSGGIQYGHCNGGSNQSGTRVERGGILICTGITKNGSNGVDLLEGGTVLLAGDVTADDINKFGAYYLISDFGSDPNRPFFNTASGGGGSSYPVPAGLHAIEGGI